LSRTEPRINSNPDRTIPSTDNLNPLHIFSCERSDKEAKVAGKSTTQRDIIVKDHLCIGLLFALTIRGGIVCQYLVMRISLIAQVKLRILNLTHKIKKMTILIPLGAQ
jgi:hypothetical protein